MITRKGYPDLGVSYYLRTFEPGEGQSFEPQVDSFKTSQDVTVLITGKLRTYNPNRVDYLDIEAGPFRIAGGTLLPGTYVIEALEYSEYCCISRIPDAQLLYRPRRYKMFNLEHVHLKAGETRTFKHADNCRAVLVMKGECRINDSDETVSTAERHDVKDESVFEAVIDTHLVAYTVL